MRTTTDILQDIDKALNELAEKSLKAEMQNTQLKETIRILAQVVRGETITQSQSDYIRRITVEANIFAGENKDYNVVGEQ